MNQSIARVAGGAVALVALVAIAGGTGAYAGSVAAKNSVATKSIQNGAVTTSKLAKHSVTAAKLKGAVPVAVTALRPVAVAHVNSDGSLLAQGSYGVKASNVQEVSQTYCFTGLTFKFKTAIANVDYGHLPVLASDNYDQTLQVAQGDPKDFCNLPGVQWSVLGVNPTSDAYADIGFYIWFFD